MKKARQGRASFVKGRREEGKAYAYSASAFFIFFMAATSI